MFYYVYVLKIKKNDQVLDAIAGELAGELAGDRAGEQGI